MNKIHSGLTFVPKSQVSHERTLIWIFRNITRRYFDEEMFSWYKILIHLVDAFLWLNHKIKSLKASANCRSDSMTHVFGIEWGNLVFAKRKSNVVGSTKMSWLSFKSFTDTEKSEYFLTVWQCGSVTIWHDSWTTNNTMIFYHFNDRGEWWGWMNETGFLVMIHMATEFEYENSCSSHRINHASEYVKFEDLTRSSSIQQFQIISFTPITRSINWCHAEMIAWWKLKRSKPLSDFC
jgi:hypothetical protein